MNAEVGDRARLAEQGLTFGPPPEGAVERPIPPVPGDGEGAIRSLLIDDQIDLRGERACSYRRVRRVMHPEGVARVAGFGFAYDPSVARAVVHHVRVIRDGVVRDAMEPAGFQLLRREPNLERRVYDGSLTADLQIPDVRPGDVVDTWFTVIGAQPLRRDHLDARFVFGWSDPVEVTAVRVRAPAGRPIAHRFDPAGAEGPPLQRVELPDGSVDHTWTASRLPVFRYAQAVPPEWIGHLSLQVADARTWTDIADVLAPLYAAPDVTADPALVDLLAEVDAIALAERTPAGRLVAAYRLVQREVRYLAVNLGDGGLVPRPVDVVWARRAGDCKDVSRVLVAVLRGLGIDAEPALVCSSGGDRIPHALPGLHAFDHCVVRFTLGGRTGWLDATGSASGGDLDHLTPACWGFGLPLVPGGDLVPATDTDEPVERLELREVFTLGPDPTSPAKLEATTVFRAWSADSLRAALRARGAASVQADWRAQYAGHYGGAVDAAPMTVQDDLATNTIRVVERYELARPWKIEDGRATFVTWDDLVRPELPVLPEPGRTQPLALGRPRRARRHTEVWMPKTWSGAGWSESVDVPGVRGTARAVIDRTLVTVAVDLAFTSSAVDVADLDRFREAMEVLRESSAITLSHRVKDGRFDDGDPEVETPRLTRWQWIFIALVTLKVLGAFARWWVP